MLLHKYLTADGCLDIIINKHLKITDPNSFNDPFEILPGVIDEPGEKETKESVEKILKARNLDLDFNNYNINSIREKIKAELMKTIMEGLKRASETMRVICFSDPGAVTKKDEVLLWAHYADKFRGARVLIESTETEIKNPKLECVKYSGSRSCVSVKDPAMLTKNAEKAYLEIFYAKNKCWEYEKEIRWLFNIEECVSVSGGSFVNIPLKAIRRIDIGCNCVERKYEAIKAALENTNIELYKVMPHEVEYSLEYVKID